MLNAQIEYATDKREHAIINDTTEVVIYWNGYIDALKTILVKLTKNKL